MTAASAGPATQADIRQFADRANFTGVSSQMPYNRYIVDAEDAPPDLIYDTMMAPPVDRVDRRYSLDEIRYSPNVRMLMPRSAA